MNIKNKQTYILTIIACVLLIVFFLQKKEEHAQELSRGVVRQEAEKADDAPVTLTGEMEQSQLSPEEEYLKRIENNLKAMHEATLAENVSYKVRGQVVDQNNNPLPGVEVTYENRKYNDRLLSEFLASKRLEKNM